MNHNSTKYYIRFIKQCQVFDPNLFIIAELLCCCYDLQSEPIPNRNVLNRQDHVDPSSSRSLLLTNFLKLIEKRFTKNQKRVLTALETFEGLTLSSSVQELSKQLNLSKPTVARALRLFRDCGLVNCGNKTERGLKLEPTELGKFAIKNLEVV
jgi:DNA-binding MarR family transcriptional regulator